MSETATIEIGGKKFIAAEVPNRIRARNVSVPRDALTAMDALGVDSVLVDEGARSTKGNDLNRLAKQQSLPVRFVTRNHRDGEGNKKICDVYATRLADVVVSPNE